jgi:hypothetical protein
VYRQGWLSLVDRQMGLVAGLGSPLVAAARLVTGCGWLLKLL